MPIKPTIIPELIEQIFEKHTKTIQDQERERELKKNKDPLKQFFIELDAVFGDLLKVALRLLDEQTITIYTTDKPIHEIVEITEGRRSKRVVKLFSNINYCQCEYFLTNTIQNKHIITLSATKEAQCSSSSKDHKSYTCQHVLALRLAKLLKAPCLRIEILPKLKFNFLLKQLHTSDDNEANDILATAFK